MHIDFEIRCSSCNEQLKGKAFGKQYNIPYDICLFIEPCRKCAKAIFDIEGGRNTTASPERKITWINK